jgi:hypothetical protein
MASGLRRDRSTGSCAVVLLGVCWTRLAAGRGRHEGVHLTPRHGNTAGKNQQKRYRTERSEPEQHGVAMMPQNGGGKRGELRYGAKQNRGAKQACTHGDCPFCSLPYSTPSGTEGFAEIAAGGFCPFVRTHSTIFYFLHGFSYLTLRRRTIHLYSCRGSLSAALQLTCSRRGLPRVDAKRPFDATSCFG